jgi:O-methyltransferase
MMNEVLRTAILGAGQGGRAVKELLASSRQVVVWLDNDPKKKGSLIDGAPVDQPEAYEKYAVDGMITGTLNRDSADALEAQMRALGYSGPIIHGVDLRDRWDIRLATLRLLARQIEARKVEGAVAELGVYQGDLARELGNLFPERPLYLFDTFEGFADEDLTSPAEQAQGRRWDFSDTSPQQVLSRISHPERVVMCPGYFPETIPREAVRYALVSLDADLYKPTLAGLDYFYPRLSPGGAILIHDYASRQFEGVGRAVDTYCSEHDLWVLPLCDFHGSAVLLRQGG